MVFFDRPLSDFESSIIENRYPLFRNLDRPLFIVWTIHFHLYAFERLFPVFFPAENLYRLAFIFGI